MFYKFLTILFSLLIFPSLLFAQQASSEVQLETVHVGGTRIETKKKPLQETFTESINPASKASNPTLGAILENQSSQLQVSPTPMKGTNLSLSGLNGEHVAIWSSGDPLLGRIDGAFDVRSVGLDGVETVSVYQGLDSLPYGSQNIAGTVLLDSPWSIFENKASIQAGAGSFGKTLLSGSAQHKKIGIINDRPAQFLFGASNFRREAIRIKPDAVDTTIDATAKFSTHLSVIQKDVAVVQGEPLNFRIGTNYYRENLKGVYGAEATTTDQNRLQIFSDLKRRDSFLHSSFSQYKRSTDGSNSNKFIEESFRFGPEINEKFSDTTLLAGSTVDFKQTRSSRIATQKNGDDTVSQTSVGSFLGARQILSSHWILGAGVRHDLMTSGSVDSYGIVNPRAEIRYLFQTGNIDHQLWAEVGSGFREATTKEQYLDFSNPAIGYRVVGNPDLKSERSMSGAVRYVIETGFLKWRASVEQFYFQDTIGYQARNPGSRDGILTYANIGRTKTLVASLGSEYKLLHLKKWMGPNWTLKLNYQWLSGERSDNGEALFLQPMHRTHFGLGYAPEKGFSFLGQAFWTSRQGFFDVNRNDKIDADEWNQAFWLLSFEAAYQFRFKPGLKIFTRIDNALNEKRESGFPNEPRSIFFGAGVEL